MVELLTTITIMGILLMVGVSAVFIYLEKSRYQAMETIASTAYDGMIMYMMESGKHLKLKKLQNMVVNPDRLK